MSFTFTFLRRIFIEPDLSEEMKPRLRPQPKKYERNQKLSELSEEAPTASSDSLKPPQIRSKPTEQHRLILVGFECHKTLYPRFFILARVINRL